MNVYQKLNSARGAFHSKQLKKSGHNKFAGYDYFELGDFVIPALNVFAEHGLTSIISFGEVATMRIVNTDNPEEVIVITSPMSEAALKGCHAVQNLGAVQTYLRRYLWVAALEIVEHDALDSSKPLDKPVVRQSATQGIGDDLPLEIQHDLKELAASAIALCDAGDAKQALAIIRDWGPVDDEITFLHRQLPSHVRAALKKEKQINQVKEA